MNIIIMKCCH